MNAYATEKALYKHHSSSLFYLFYFCSTILYFYFAFFINLRLTMTINKQKCSVLLVVRAYFFVLPCISLFDLVTFGYHITFVVKKTTKSETTNGIKKFNKYKTPTLIVVIEMMPIEGNLPIYSSKMKCKKIKRKRRIHSKLTLRRAQYLSDRFLSFLVDVYSFAFGVFSLRLTNATMRFQCLFS